MKPGSGFLRCLTLASSKSDIDIDLAASLYKESPFPEKRGVKIVQKSSLFIQSAANLHIPGQCV